MYAVAEGAAIVSAGLGSEIYKEARFYHTKFQFILKHYSNHLFTEQKERLNTLKKQLDSAIQDDNLEALPYLIWDAKAEFNNLPDMPSNTTPNSYDVLEVSPAASKQEITKAFTQAMKKRKYSTDIIAKARKSLTNSRERIKADYLRPILPIPKRFKRQDYSELKSTSPNFSLLSDYDNLEQMIEESQSISSLDQKIGTKLVNSLLSEDS